MFLYIKTNILRGYGIFKNDFAHTREPATVLLWNINSIPKVVRYSATQNTIHVQSGGRFPLRVQASSRFYYVYLLFVKIL